MLTFDEFLSIPPCTTGKHSNVEEGTSAADTFSKPSREAQIEEAPAVAVVPPRLPRAEGAPRASPSPAPLPESESDDPELPISPGQSCRRRGCTGTYDVSKGREDESCVHHPGAPIFHEGSKGYSCCKRRVLEFSEFLKIEGCQKKPRHLFVGRGKTKQSSVEVLENVRHDFYQTSTTIIASVYLKKIDKEASTIELTADSLIVDLRTDDSKRYNARIPLWGLINPSDSKYNIMGTKLEFSLAKVDGSGWPVFRADERTTGEIIQTGRAGRA